MGYSGGFSHIYIIYDSEYEPRRGGVILQGEYVSGSLFSNSGLGYDFFDPRDYDLRRRIRIGFGVEF